MVKRNSTAVIAALLAFGLAAPVFAQDMLSGAEAIAKRQELMKSNGMALRSAGQAAPGPEAVAAAETIVGNFDMVADLWPEDSAQGDTKALPVIWEDMDGFKLAMSNAQDAAAALLEAARGDDATAYQAAFKALGATCGACHQTYKAN